MWGCLKMICKLKYSFYYFCFIAGRGGGSGRIGARSQETGPAQIKP